MLSKRHINDLMSEIKSKGRMLDYYLLKNLFECRQLQIIDTLKTYQNEDGGFGHGLEPDNSCPCSSVVATDEAVCILENIDDFSLKEPIIKAILRYYEAHFIEAKKGWELVPPEVDQYPRAVWWNYDGVDHFTYGNPNPQIVGFLWKYRHLVETLDVKALKRQIIEYIETDFPKESSKHNTLSILYFYRDIDDASKALIKPYLEVAIAKELENTNWENYGLEPYEVLLIWPEFLEPHKALLEKNLNYQKERIEAGLIMPNWHWGQYDEVFREVRYQWAGYLTFRVIKALLI